MTSFQDNLSDSANSIDTSICLGVSDNHSTVKESVLSDASSVLEIL